MRNCTVFGLIFGALLLVVSNVGRAKENTCQGFGFDLAACFDGNVLSLVKHNKQAKDRERVKNQPIWWTQIEHGFLVATADLAVDIKVHTLTKGQMALHLVVADGLGGVFEAALIKKDKTSKPKIIWSENTTLKGDIGELSATKLRFEDLSGDGFPEIVMGTVYQPVTFCGKSNLPLLFRKVYDVRSEKFRSVSAKRLGTVPSVEIKGAWVKNKRKSLVKTVSPRGMSRVMGDKAQPVFLGPPMNIMDGNSKTAWIPGTGVGEGEFVTFGVNHSYGLSEIGVSPLAQTGGKQKYATPMSLLLVSDKEVHRLVFPSAGSPEKSETGEGQMVWFELPKPVKTSCLSVVVESIQSAGPNVPLAISEMAFLTELDRPGGLEQLAMDLGDAKKGEQAVRLLQRLGKKVVGPILNQWKILDNRGKRRAAAVLAEAAPVESAKLLARCAVENAAFLSDVCLKGVQNAGQAGAMAVIPLLQSQREQGFVNAAVVLSKLETPLGVKGLVSVAGKGSGQRREKLRGLISNAASKSPVHATALLESIQAASIKGQKERLLDLLRAAAVLERLGEKVTELAVAIYPVYDDFNDRYRLVQVFLFSGHPSAVPTLLSAAKDSDALIREVAILALAPYQNKPSVASAFYSAISDNAVQVRLAGISKLDSPAVSTELETALVAQAKRDPWPIVRIGATKQSGLLSNEAELSIVLSALLDSSPQVRNQGLIQAADILDKKLDQAIIDRLSDENEQPEVVATAAMTAGVRCQAGALPHLYTLLKKGAEPLALSEDTNTAVIAAAAIGKIGGAEAQKMLKKAAQRSNPTTDKAIAAGLRNLGNGCVRHE